MAQKTRTELQAKWIFDYLPTETDYDDVWDSFVNILDDSVGIYRPTTEPSIVTGTPNTLLIDCDSNSECMFEPIKSTGVPIIDIDFSLSFSNETQTDLISLVFQLSGSRTITMPSGVLVSNPSSIGVWTGTPTNTLALASGTGDIIEMQLLRYKNTSNWVLKVGEPAI